MQNWAGNLTYTSSEILAPTTVDELQRLVTGHPHVKALGSRHSFSDVADTEGVHLSVAGLPAELVLDHEAATVTCSAGLTHAEVSAFLHEHDLALANLASLPHISLAGAVQTGTHGSGARNRALSASVTAFELVDASGTLHRLTRDHPDFEAVLVGLGAFGVIVSVTHEVVPAFEVEQRVYEAVPWRRLLPELEPVMASAYSVSLFTRFDGDDVHQIWVKRRSTDPAPAELTRLGGTPASVRVHPLPETAADNVTEQLGVPGPSHHRLPHFRHDFQPGRGDEIQSEYLLDVSAATDAIEAVRGLGDEVAPLLHMAEIRRVAADDAWLSPSGGRDSVAIHFTWRSLPDRVLEVLPRLEAGLLPLGARPHWGKVFVADAPALARAYPRLDDFAAVVRRRDPDRKFDNAFLRRVLGDR